MKPKTMPVQEIVIILAIGLGAGILSGLIGIGGGIIMVPALVFFLNYEQHQAQGTSLAVLTLPVVILGSLTYYQECKELGTPLDTNVILLLAATFIVGAFAGSHIAVKIDKLLLKKLFAIVLFYTAIKMLNWDTLLIKSIKGLFAH
jgi:uncharacterized membrane protein YfcA